MQNEQSSPVQSAEILLIDDEQSIADVVEYVLQEHGFQVQTRYDGVEGLAAFEHAPPDLVLLDLNLPGLDGLSLFHRMKNLHAEVPVIMLTSRGDEVDRILGLELGADDYVTKPFSPRELAARVRAVLRRQSRSKPGTSSLVRQGLFVVDEAGFHLRYDGSALVLTRPEFLLLSSLVRQPARVFTRQHLLDIMHEQGHPVTDRAVDACIKRLRKKLEEVRPGEDPIQTVYGLGYKLRHEPEGA